MRIFEIAICDDKENHNLKLYKQITKILTDNNIGYTISIFNSGLSLTEEINSGAYYDLAFLDVLMEDINGIEAAKKIRKRDKNIGIVFLTSCPDYVFQGYDVKATNYILKPATTEKLSNILLECFYDMVLPKYIDIKDKNGNHKVLINDIYFAESNNKKIIIHTKKDNFELYKKLDELETALPRQVFVRCHKSYLVNLLHILNIKGHSMLLKTKKQIPISRSNYQFVKKIFTNYIEQV
jgi:DNA-binding LytR/AlgR family response regulator